MPFDEDLLRRLPLPLAQLYRRALNAKSALERHQAAYYLWEAGLKLLASAAVAAYGAQPQKSPELSERLKNLARPSLGHWWELVRRLVPLLADAGDSGFHAVRELVLGRTREDLPRAAGLDAALREEMEGAASLGGQTTVRLTELFDRLVRYRNRELGHGAAGQRSHGFYDKMGRALLLGTSEILAKVDVLAGRQLTFVDHVERAESATWRVSRSELAGENARRLEDLELPLVEAATLPDPNRVYLLAIGGSPPAQPVFLPLHPLIVYDPEGSEVFFLSARRGERRAEFLSYATGRVLERDAAGGETALFLERVLGRKVEPGAFEAWAEKSQAEEPSAVEEARAPVSPAGRRLGGFELLSRIGRGGMGVVYRAWQPSLARQVALKCLLRSGDPKAEARFAREIRSLGRVEHPNLVKIFTSGADGDQWFYAMELIDGADLASVCEGLAGSSASEVSEAEWRRALTTACEAARQREQPIEDGEPAGGGRASGEWPGSGPAAPSSSHARHKPALVAGEGHIAQAVDVVRQVAEAAHALHEAGVIHRDIKPGNVLLTRDGLHAVLMDLGLAQLVDDAHGRLTRTRQFVGTLRYASPEQVLAAGALDRRSDVYSLGATLWELLTLRPLFGAGEATPTPELMLRIQSADPESPRRLNPRVPQDLEAIALKCLEKDRTRRYATAMDLAEDLARFQRGEPVLAQAPSFRYLLGKYVRRHQGRFAAGAVIVLLALAMNFGAFWRVNEARKHATEAQKATETALFDTYTSHGISAGDAGNPAQAVLWFANAAFLAQDDAKRQEANRLRIRNWGRLVPKPLQAFGHDGEGLKRLEFDATDAYLLTVTLNDRCTVWDVEAERKLELPALSKPVRLAAWSPKGDLLALARPEGGLELIRFPGGGTVHSIEGGAPVRALAFGPRGDVLAYAGEGLAALDLRSHGFPRRTWPHPKAVSSVSFSERGDRVVTGCEDGLARVFALEDTTGAAPLFPPVPCLARESLRLRPIFIEGDEGLLTLLDVSTLAWWDAATGKESRRLQAADAVSAFSTSPDGSLLAVAGSELDLELWNLSARRSLGLLHRQDRKVLRHAFSPDGMWLATAELDQQLRLWLLSTDDLYRFRKGPEWLVLQGRVPHPPGVNYVAFSSDGGFFASAQPDGLVRLWSLPRARPWHHRLPLRMDLQRVALSPDDRWLLAVGGGDWMRAPRQSRAYHLETGKPAGPFLDAGGILLDGAFSPDSTRAVTLSTAATAGYQNRPPAQTGEVTPGSIRVWDFRTGKLICPPLLTPSEPWGAAFDRSGKRLFVLCANGELWTLNAETGARLGVLEHGQVAPGRRLLSGKLNLVQLTADGRSLVTAGLASQVKVWEAEEVVKERFPALEQAGEESWYCQISPGDRFLGVVWSNYHVLVYDLATGQAASPPLIHPNSVWGIDFSPDATLLLTACRDGMVRIWRWNAGELAGPPLQHPAWVWSAQFVPATRWLVTQTNGYYSPEGGRLQFWEWETGKAVSPPVASPGAYLQFTHSGMWAVDWTELCTPVLRLEDFTTPEPTSDRLEDARTWGELLSSQTLQAGGGLNRLSTAEWLERWGALRERQPSTFVMTRSPAERQAWHRERAGELEDDLEWDAAAWHLRKLKEMGGAVEPRDEARLEEFVRSWHFFPETKTWPDMKSFIPWEPEELKAIEAAALAKRPFRSAKPYVDYELQFPEKSTYAVGYAVRRIACDQPRDLKLWAGSDDALRVWVNGALVLSDREEHAALPDTVSADIHLRSGINTLTAEVSNGYGKWRLYLRLEDPSGRKLRLTDDDRLEELPPWE